jgi:hypothetical protein
MYAQVNTGALANFSDLFFDLFAGFVHHFLDPGRVNASISNQSMQSHTRNFAAEWIEAAQYNGFWRIVDLHFHPSGCFEGPYVSSFATYNLTFNLVVFNGKYRDGIFN